jgi:branched-chain amino acid transport system permease protein
MMEDFPVANFLQLLVYGLQLGSIYALLAIGYSMVFGIVRMINMAHCDFLMMGCYIVYFLVTVVFGGAEMIGPAVALLVIMIGSSAIGMVGVGIEAIAYRPLRSRPTIMCMISAIGVSIFTQNLFRALPFIGPTPRHFPKLIPDQMLALGPVQISSARIVTITLSIIIMIILYTFVQYSKIGMHMRAVSNNKDAASLMGVNINRVISMTFFIGAFLAAVSGSFYATSYPVVQPTMATTLGNKAFIAAVVGGIGDIRGAVLGGFLIGVTEILVTSVWSDFAYGFCFLVLVVVLLFKPEGLLGKPTTEKV